MRWCRLEFEDDPLASEGFVDVSATMRLEIVYTLCEWRLHEDATLKEFAKLASETEPSELKPAEKRQAELLRPEPIGEDSGGRQYFWCGEG